MDRMRWFLRTETMPPLALICSNIDVIIAIINAQTPAMVLDALSYLI